MTAQALESGYWSSLTQGMGAILLYALAGLLLMLVGFFAIDMTTPGRLRSLVVAGKPNAIIVTAAGMVSMALIVVLAIYTAGGRLLEGLIAALVFGLVGIVAQIASVRILERLVGVDIGAVLHSELYTTEVLVVAAAHFSVGLVVAVAIV